MAANINDKFRKTFNSENPNVTFVSSTRTALATTLSCDSLTGWPTDTAVDFITYKLDTDGETVIPGSQTDWKGIVSGSTITELTRVAGAADAGNDVNDIVEMTPTGSWANDLVSNLLISHDQDGTLKDDVVTTAKLADSSVTTAKLADSSVTTAKLADGAVTAGKTTGIWWEELGRTTLSSASDTITLSSIPARKYLRVLMYVAATGGTVSVQIRFNSDSGNNYSQRTSTNGGADSSSLSQAQLLLAGASAYTNLIFESDAMLNVAGVEKDIVGTRQGNFSGTGAGTAPDRGEFAGKWANTSSQISRVDVINSGTGDFAIGSEVIVLGHD